MPNEMIRPCTLWGATFDAMKVVSLNEERKESPEHYVRVCISTPHPANPYDSLCVVLSPQFMPPLEAFRIANNVIAEALNPPIKVTQAVLDAMEKAGGVYIAKSILVNAPDYSYNLHFDEQKRAFTFRSGMAFNVNEQDVPIYTVQADCPLALQVLLDFDIEGEKYA